MIPMKMKGLAASNPHHLWITCLCNLTPAISYFTAVTRPKIHWA